jgi:hypothetical protein
MIHTGEGIVELWVICAYKANIFLKDITTTHLKFYVTVYGFAVSNCLLCGHPVSITSILR